MRNLGRTKLFRFGKHQEIAPLKPGDWIDNWLIVGEGQSGSTAVAHRAWDTELDRAVCLKISKYRPCNDVFKEEGRKLAAIRHPGVCQVHAVSMHYGWPYIVTEFIDGYGTLAEYAQSCRPSPQRCADIIAQVAHALEAVHARGVIHQDISPTNILMDTECKPRLIDFGIAWGRSPMGLGFAGVLGGTPNYMSPERLLAVLSTNRLEGEDMVKEVRELCAKRSEPVSDPPCAFSRSADETLQRDEALQRNEDPEPPTQSCDTYALGAVLFELLTDARPQDAAFNDRKLQAAGIDRRLRRICLKAIEAEPERRYDHAHVFAADLERYARRRRFLGGSVFPCARKMKSHFHSFFA